MRNMKEIYFSANLLLRNCTPISTLRSIRNYLCRFSSSGTICCLVNQQKPVQVFQYCVISNRLLYVKINNTRYFSTTYALAKSKDRGKDKKKQKQQNVDFNELEQVIDASKLTSQLDMTMEDLKNNFVKYLSVRSSIGAIEQLSVKFEGKDYTLQELAQISRKPTLIVLNISTFPQAIPDILNSIRKNQMKLNPQQDGTTIYIPIPKVTKEHRENLSKNAKSFYVKCCNNIREIRNKQIKVLKQKELAKDLVFRVEGYVDNLSHQYMNQAEQLLETKQKELLGDSE